MDVSLLNILAKGMSELMAEEQLYLMDALCYPHMNQKERNKSHKKWYKQAYPENFDAKIIKTTDLELF